MASDAQIHHGIVHGKIIQLDQDAGLPDGQKVAVVMQAVTSGQAAPTGEGIRRSAGGWADDPAGLDEFLAWTREQRKATRRGCCLAS